MKNTRRGAPWNKGKLIGQKAPLKLKELWAIRVRLQLSGHTRNLAPFNLAIDSKLRGCDLTCLRVRDISQGTSISSRAIVLQRKTRRPVQFEISEQTRAALLSWIHSARLGLADYLFPGRHGRDTCLSTRQYARIVDAWVASRLRSAHVRHPQHASHQGGAHLPANHKPLRNFRTDITYYSDRKGFYLAFEWRKLKPTSQSRKAYCGSEGMGRFLEPEGYAKNEPFGLMVGIIESPAKRNCVSALAKADEEGGRCRHAVDYRRR